MKRNNKVHVFFVTIFLLFVDCYYVAYGQVYLANDYQTSRKFVESIPLPQNESKKIQEDLYALFTAYPVNCTGIEIAENKALYVIMKNGARIIYDDRKQKSFEEKLADPDLHDMLEQKYDRGSVNENPAENIDPGRIRVISFFQAIYGRTESGVIRNSRNMQFLNQRVIFNAIEGAADALQNVHKNLSLLIKEKPELARYVNSMGGTLNWRVIEGTQRFSPHSFAIAIDLNPDQSAYWRWGIKTDIHTLRKDYPQSIVSIFEAQGFIWGGKWYHYDLMHFEYRPELLPKNDSSMTAQTDDVQLRNPGGEYDSGW